MACLSHCLFFYNQYWIGLNGIACNTIHFIKVFALSDFTSRLKTRYYLACVREQIKDPNPQKRIIHIG